MQKLLNIIPVLILLSSTVSAQSRVGIKAGISHANVYANNDPTKNFLRARTSAMAGVSVELFATSRFSVQPELNYSYQVASETFNYSLLTWSYVQIPILAKFYLPDNSFNLYVGPQLGFLSKANQKLHGVKTNLKNQLQQTDFGGVAGVGYAFKRGLTLDVRGYHGAVNVFKSEFDQGVRTRNVLFTLALGYVFGAKK
ncbi:MAG TPA: porin family protein [Flavitalea sp.]|nr:porin family protein [Flavitalea sp.]